MIKLRCLDWRYISSQATRKGENVLRDLIAVFQLADTGFKLGNSLGFGGLVFTGRAAVEARF